MAEGLYLGKIFDEKTGNLGQDYRLRASDLTTHGIVIGMTGSGKTGLSIVLIEEAVKAGIPVIVIDPKGDMPNLALAFPSLEAAEFRPWIDADAAAREGRTPDLAAEEAAQAWARGLGEWGLSGSDVSAYAAAREVRVITPGSLSGVPLNLIESLEPPSAEVMAEEEEFRDQVDAVVTALLGLIGIKADPIGSREYILVSHLIELAWRRNQGMSLEALIGQVATPPLERIGALPVDAFFPPADRNRLMLALNNLLASPSLAAWRQGSPVDIEEWLRTPDGRPRVSIVYTSHLDEEQRIFVTALLLNKVVSWVRRQPGTGDLRCLLYMDEIFGYFPPTENPPTKKPLLTLLKQARAHGLGVLLSTQNPVDLDYRGLSNMGFWAIGRLQTTQDQARIRSGIEAALEDSAFAGSFDNLIAGVQKRVFLVHDIHRGAPALVHSRWAMSYLRGPITRDEIERLPGAATEAASAARTQAATGPAPGSSPPPLPAPLKSRYLNRFGGNVASPHLFVKAAVRYKSGTVATPETVHSFAFPINASHGPGEVMAGTPMPIDEAAIHDEQPVGVTYADLPAFVAVQGAKGLERTLRDRLDETFTVNLLFDPLTKELSRPGEAMEDFALRLRDAPAVQAKRRSLESKLTAKRAAIQDRQAEAKARGMEKWASIGTSILSNVNILFGRKRTVTGVGGVLTKQRMESTTRARIERLQAEAAELEEELTRASTIDPLRFESRSVKPARGDVSLIRYDILWVT